MGVIFVSETDGEDCSATIAFLPGPIAFVNSCGKELPVSGIYRLFFYDRMGLGSRSPDCQRVKKTSICKVY